MAITEIAGRVALFIDVNFSAGSKSEIQAAINIDPATYSGKTFNLPDGSFVFTDSSGVMVDGPESFDVSKAAVDGPIDLSSGVVSVTETSNLHNYDPTINGLSGVNVLEINATSNIDITGVVSPNKNKTLIIYNNSQNGGSIIIKASSGSSSVVNTFDMAADHTIPPKSAALFSYSNSISRWVKYF